MVPSSVDRFFGISENGSTVSTEFKGAILIFLSTLHITVVNMRMMGEAGMDAGAAFTSVVLLAIIGSLAMGLYAKFPVVMAVGMSINTMFCYTAVIAMGFTWQESLLAVFISGLLFMVTTVTGVRGKVLASIPVGVKIGVTAGIGCFILMIGIKNVGILDPSSWGEPTTLLATFSIVTAVLLVWRRVAAGILFALIITIVVGAVFGIVDLPNDPISMPDIPPIGAFLEGFGPRVLSPEFMILVVSFLFMDLFDGSSQLLAAGRRSGKTDDTVEFRHAMAVDSLMVPVSGIMGSSPVIPIVESVTAVEAGARTGLTSVFYALLLFLALFVSGIFESVGFDCVIGAMVIVSSMMIYDLRLLPRDDVPSIASAAVMVVSMIVLDSIAFGLALGVITYVVVAFVLGRGDGVNRMMYGLSAMFVAYILLYILMF